jgi:TonB family protein
VTAYPNVRGEDIGAMHDARSRTGSSARRLVALTNDDTLSRALEELAAGGTDVTIVPNMQSLSEELLHSSSSIALVDVAAIDAPIDGLVDALATQFPDLRLLVAGHGADQTLLATRISSQRVFRFVHKPASPQRLKLFIDAAARPVDPRSTSQAADLLGATGAHRQLNKIDTAIKRSSSSNVAIIGVGVIAIVAVAAWVFWPSGNKPSSVSSPAAPATIASTTPSPDSAVVAKADQAFAAGRYIASDGTSAAELYRDALKLDPKDARARSGFDRSIDLGMRGAEEALLADKVDEAASKAEALRLLVPNNSRLTFLQTQLDKDRARANADASQRAANDTRQAQIKSTLADMSDRMRRGALIDPARDSALSLFREAETLGPSEPTVRNAREALVAALLTAADNELNARRVPAGRRLIDAAASVNSGAPGLDVIRRRADEVSAQIAASTQAAAVVAPPLQEAAPAPLTVVKSAEEVAAIVSAATLRQVKRVEPEYPPRALDQLISGWVEMEFTVAVDGTVKDVVVTASEPKSTFDSAATAALRRWRFAPVVRDGQAVTQRVRTRMRFTAQDSRR